MYQIEMYVDELSSCVSTPESEYADIENDLREHIFGEVECRFKSGVTPANISPSTCIYVIDVGGLIAYHMNALANRLTRDLINKINDNPDTFFILWSSFTVSNYLCMACDDKDLDCLSDFQVPKNVYLFKEFEHETNMSSLDKIRLLLGLPEVAEEIKDKLLWEKHNDLLSTDEEMD